MSISDFLKNPSSNIRIETCGQTDRRDRSVCVNFLHIVEITHSELND
jgi:hypothetical protein